jgi:hypothetical protein
MLVQHRFHSSCQLHSSILLQTLLRTAGSRHRMLKLFEEFDNHQNIPCVANPSCVKLFPSCWEKTDIGKSWISCGRNLERKGRCKFFAICSTGQHHHTKRLLNEHLTFFSAKEQPSPWNTARLFMLQWNPEELKMQFLPAGCKLSMTSNTKTKSGAALVPHKQWGASVSFLKPVLQIACIRIICSWWAFADHIFAWHGRADCSEIWGLCDVDLSLQERLH